MFLPRVTSSGSFHSTVHLHWLGHGHMTIASCERASESVLAVEDEFVRVLRGGKKKIISGPR